MAQIPVSVKLVNPKDTFVRIFGIWLDKLPPIDWTRTLASQATANHREFVSNNDPLVVTSLEMADGEHKVYFSISQNEKSTSLGIWSGIATFGTITRPFNKVDVDTFAVFDIEVKNGKVIERTNQDTGEDKTPPADEDKDSEESVSTRIIDKVKGAKAKVTIANIRDLWNEHKLAILSSAGGAGVVVAGVVVWKETKKRRF